MIQEESRKRPSEALLCDPALQRLRKAARAVAVAQKLAKKQQAPTLLETLPKQGNDVNLVSVPVTITGKEQGKQLAISPSISSASSSQHVAHSCAVDVPTGNVVVTPSSQVVVQSASRGPSPHVASSIDAPTEIQRQVVVSHNGERNRPLLQLETKKAPNMSPSYGPMKPNNVSVSHRSNSSGVSTETNQRNTSLKKAVGTNLDSIHNMRQQSNENDHVKNPEVFPHDETSYGSYAPSRFDQMIRFVQLFVPMMALLMAARTMEFSVNGISKMDAPLHNTNSPLTLRDILKDHERGFHLAMAPAFFGFYGYFGALAAWYEVEPNLPVQSLAGASAGAMAAVLIGAGISPKTAADFCSEMTVSRFADFPGFGAIFRGHKFERIMDEFLQSATNRTTAASWRLEEAVVPVAVTAFDLQSFQGIVLTTGSMARAARASATFPLLFQPVGWTDGSSSRDYVFVDGGIADPNGLVGLTKTLPPSTSPRRIVNLSIGSLLPVRPPFDLSKTELITVSIHGLPQPSPLAMAKGPMAYEKARKAMLAALDTPLRSRGDGFELSIHAGRF